MSTLLFEVSVTDPMTFAAVLALLAVVALLLVTFPGAARNESRSDDCAQRRIGEAMQTLWQDLRYGLRMC